MNTTTNKTDKNEAAVAELRAAGCELLRREDRHGETHAGWWQDDCYLGKDPRAALRILRGGL